MYWLVQSYIIVMLLLIILLLLLLCCYIIVTVFYLYYIIIDKCVIQFSIIFLYCYYIGSIDNIF